MFMFLERGRSGFRVTRGCNNELRVVDGANELFFADDSSEFSSIVDIDVNWLPIFYCLHILLT